MLREASSSQSRDVRRHSCRSSSRLQVPVGHRTRRTARQAGVDSRQGEGCDERTEAAGQDGGSDRGHARPGNGRRDPERPVGRADRRVRRARRPPLAARQRDHVPLPVVERQHREGRREGHGVLSGPGEKVIGGGWDQAPRDRRGRSRTIPLTDGSGWRVQFIPPRAATTCLHSGSMWAVCLKVS